VERPNELGLCRLKPMFHLEPGTKWPRGIVDKYAQGAEGIFRECHEIEDLALIPHIGTEERRSAAIVPDELDSFLAAYLVEIGHDDGGTMTRQMRGDRSTAARAAGAGHDGRTILQSHSANLPERRTPALFALRPDDVREVGDDDLVAVRPGGSSAPRHEA
jgi:hypothetical protein